MKKKNNTESKITDKEEILIHKVRLGLAATYLLFMCVSIDVFLNAG